MDIIFDKGTNHEEVIPESEILKMSKQDIKNLCEVTEVIKPIYNLKAAE